MSPQNNMCYNMERLDQTIALSVFAKGGKSEHGPSHKDEEKGSG